MDVNFLNVEYWLRLLYLLLHSHGDYSRAALIARLVELWRLFSYVAYLLSVFFLGALVYYTIRLRQIREAEAPKFATIHPEHHEDHAGHARWEHVQGLMNSLQESDWRQAIIEANIMLDEVLHQRGYPGDTMSDRMQSIRADKFPAIDGLWEAHRLRNRLAHDGSAFKLDARMATRAINQFEAAFRDWHVI